MPPTTPLRPGVDLARLVRDEQVRFTAKRASRLMRVLAWLLALVGNKRFMSHQWTALGSTLYYPDSVELDLDWLVYGKASTEVAAAQLERYEPIVLHELQHIRDARRWPVVFQLSYLLLPLPLLLAWARVYWEARAYAINIVHHQQQGYTVQRCADILWSNYLWPLPRPWIRAELRRHVKRIAREERQRV